VSATIAITATLLALWAEPTDKAVIQGDAAFYPSGLMEQVCETRGLDMSNHEGAAALMRCGDLGRTVWVLGKPLIVCDCSRRDHFEMNLERGRAIDLSWDVWQEFGFPLAPTPVEVSFVQPGYTREGLKPQ
jgi:hypothetical protein